MKRNRIKSRLALNLETIKQLDDLRAVAGGRDGNSLPPSACTNCTLFGCPRP
jgi:hypothetical protein